MTFTIDVNEAVAREIFPLNYTSNKKFVGIRFMLRFNSLFILNLIISQFPNKANQKLTFQKLGGMRMSLLIANKSKLSQTWSKLH